MDSLKRIATNYKLNGERVFIFPKRLTLHEKNWCVIFYYRGSEIMGIPLNDPQMTGGLVVNEEGMPSRNRSMVARLCQASLVFLQETKPDSVQAFLQVPDAAKRSLESFQNSAEKWRQFLPDLIANERDMAQKGLAKLEEIVCLLEEVEKNTIWVYPKLKALYDSPTIAIEEIDRILNAHNSYQNAGRSANLKMMELREVVQSLSNNIRSNRSAVTAHPAQGTRGALQYFLSDIARSLRMASPESFSNTLTESLSREMDEFISGYRIPFEG
ncbi:MAG: hypothetical protein FJ009_03155 [Chloroflexi bacterium]|nr:hypothetical protein [Chloroflexota bacterium]